MKKLKSINEHIKENLTYYLKEETPEYAFLLSGAWGIGKTHFINDYISKFTKSTTKLIKISLFGLSSTSDIDATIFQTLHPILGSKYARLAGNVLKGAITLGVKIDFDGDKKEDGTANVKFDKVFLSDFFSDEKPNIAIIFDDVERSGIPIHEALGYINYLVEVTKIKVILVANEKHLIESEDTNKIYSKFKEKVIGKTFELKHDFELIASDFLKGVSYEKMAELKALISEIHAISEHQNLRQIKQIIYDFQYLCSWIDSNHLSHHEFYLNLARTFFALSIEAKNGGLNEEKLRADFPFNNKDIKYRKYFPQNNLIFNADLWVNIIFKGRYDEVGKHTSTLAYFIKKEEKDTPAWLRLWSFRTLENEEFQTLITKLDLDFENLEEFELPEYLNRLDLLIYFSNHKIYKKSLTTTKKTVIQYIEKYKKSDHWKKNLIGGGRYYGSGRSYYSENNQDFIDLKMLILKENKATYEEEVAKTTKKAFKDRTTEFLRAIETGDTKSLSNTLLKTFETKTFLDTIDPKAFSEALVKTKHATIENFMEIIFQRYAPNRFLDNQPYAAYLKSEIIFWEETEAILQKKSQSLHGLKKHIFELLITETLPRVKASISF